MAADPKRASPSSIICGLHVGLDFERKQHLQGGDSRKVRRLCRVHRSTFGWGSEKSRSMAMSARGRSSAFYGSLILLNAIKPRGAQQRTNEAAQVATTCFISQSQRAYFPVDDVTLSPDDDVHTAKLDYMFSAKAVQTRK